MTITWYDMFDILYVIDILHVNIHKVYWAFAE